IEVGDGHGEGPEAVGGQAGGCAEADAAGAAAIEQHADGAAVPLGVGVGVAAVGNDEVELAVAVDILGLHGRWEHTPAADLVRGGEAAAARPPEDVQGPDREGLALVHRHAGNGGTDVLDPVAVKVGDGGRRRNELDLRGQGSDRAGEGEIPVPLEDRDILALNVLPNGFAVTGDDAVGDIVPGHVGEPD